jgi:DNA-directed RNA polymerase subunit beta
MKCLKRLFADSESFDIPNLIQVQKESFDRLLSDGLIDLFDEISPIESYNGGVKLYFPGKSNESKQWGLKYWFEDPKNSIEECVEKDLTFSSPLYVKVLLAGSEIAEPMVEDIYLGEFP